MNDSELQPEELLQGKLGTEYKTLRAMMKIYCRDHHGSKELCSDCEELLSYAVTKLDRCPYGEEKPACNKCPIHCYKPEPREQMRAIMRYSGPRMLWSHPILAIRHLLHAKQDAPQKPKPNASNRYKRTHSKK